MPQWLLDSVFVFISKVHLSRGQRSAELMRGAGRGGKDVCKPDSPHFILKVFSIRWVIKQKN